MEQRGGSSLAPWGVSINQDSDNSDDWAKDSYVEIAEIKFRP